MPIAGLNTTASRSGMNSCALTSAEGNRRIPWNHRIVWHKSDLFVFSRPFFPLAAFQSVHTWNQLRRAQSPRQRSEQLFSRTDYPEKKAYSTEKMIRNNWLSNQEQKTEFNLRALWGSPSRPNDGHHTRDSSQESYVCKKTTPSSLWIALPANA